jgi:hypothetical protein
MISMIPMIHHVAKSLTEAWTRTYIKPRTQHLKKDFITSITACRKTLRAGKKNRNFDFKSLKTFAQLYIS